MTGERGHFHPEGPNWKGPSGVGLCAPTDADGRGCCRWSLPVDLLLAGTGLTASPRTRGARWPWWEGCRAATGAGRCCRTPQGGRPSRHRSGPLPALLQFLFCFFFLNLFLCAPQFE